MPANNNAIICFDFETGGVDHQVHEPLSLAAIAIDPRRLVQYPNGEFKETLMRPPGDEKDWKIEAKALEINSIKIEDVRNAMPRAEVWKEFARFVNKYNPKGLPTSAPIPAGQNIKNFDLHIAERLCRENNILNRDKKPFLFNQRNQLDLVDITFLWFENNDELANHKMDTLRDYFSITKDGAHSAMVDVKQTADLIVRFMKLHRKLFPSIPFKGSFAKPSTN